MDKEIRPDYVTRTSDQRGTTVDLYGGPPCSRYSFRALSLNLQHSVFSATDPKILRVSVNSLLEMVLLSARTLAEFA